MSEGAVRLCGRCGAEPLRAGQRTCNRCHAAAMREERARQKAEANWAAEAQWRLTEWQWDRRKEAGVVVVTWDWRGKAYRVG